MEHAGTHAEQVYFARVTTTACYAQAGARKVYAVEASAMADYCALLKDANPGAAPV